MVDDEIRVMTTPKMAVASTTGGKYANPTTVYGVDSKINLSVDKTMTLKPKMKIEGKSKSILSQQRYEVSDTSIATVNSKGKLVAKKKGTCYVYIYAQNGVYQKVKVTIK